MVYLVFSLMLLISGTIITLGSPIKDDGTEIEALLTDAGLSNFPEMVPNRKDLEALLMRSNQSNPLMEKQTEMSVYRQEPNDLLDRGSKTKREAATVIAGAALGFVVLDSVLNALADVNRKVAIGIDNESGYKWTALNVYFYSGTSDIVIPHDVDSGKALLYGARKTSYSVKGAVGVMTYYIPKMDRTLAVMFSIPYDYNWYSNWWNVELKNGKHKADYDMYYGLYYGEPMKGDHHWHSKNLGQGLYARGAMSDSSKATLEIHVKKN